MFNVFFRGREGQLGFMNKRANLHSGNRRMWELPTQWYQRILGCILPRNRELKIYIIITIW